MRKESLAFLKKLLSTPSPSGYESKIQRVCKSYVQPHVDKVYKDVHGNQYAVRNPKGKLRVMLAGHVDEIAPIVNHVDTDGFLGFLPIGGIDASAAPTPAASIPPAPASIRCKNIRRCISLCSGMPPCRMVYMASPLDK